MHDMLVNEILSTPLFGILVSLLAYQAGLLLYRKSRNSLFNPLLVGCVLVILFLLHFGIDIGDYNRGGDYISFFLGPATVILAVPLYKRIKLLKSDALPILSGIVAGSFAGISCVLLLTHLFGFDESLSSSLVPKSVTTPIGIEISKQIGGLPAVTVAAIVLTGIIGAVIGPAICRTFHITDRVAVGVAFGTSAHALGTTKAVEIGETEGAMSGLALGIAGLITVFLAPALVHVFRYLL